MTPHYPHHPPIARPASQAVHLPATDALGEAPRHVALVGMPGAGKTTTGELLAQRLHIDFVDLDADIAEAAAKPLTALFAEQGEVMFRARERARLRELLARPRPMVIACGGGTWADAIMQRDLLLHARPVLLQAPLEVLLGRLEAENQRNTRPLLQGPDPRAALERLWRAREAMHALCPMQTDTSAQSPSDVADKIAEMLRQDDIEQDQTGPVRALGEAAPAAKAPRVQKRQDTSESVDAPADTSTAGIEAAAPAADEARSAAAPAADNMPRAEKKAAPQAAMVPQNQASDANPNGALDTFPIAVPQAPVDVLCSRAEQDFLLDVQAFVVPAPQPPQVAVAPPVQAANDAEDAQPSTEPAAYEQTEAPAHLRPADDDSDHAPPMLRVKGALGEYPIYLFDTGSDAVAERIDEHSHGTRVSIVSDTQVSARHAESLVDALRARGLAVNLHTFAAGEESKRLSTAHVLYDELADAGHGRDDTLVALGGGVVTDVAGFVASTYMRGLPFLQVPTSTLAAVDACIGGKTGLNTRRGKNLVGTFYAPRAVVISTAYLSTQSVRAHVAGLVEAVKIAALTDEPLLQLIRENARSLARGTPHLLREVIGRALAHKARIVEEDEHERGARALLNFGHTFGHAIEVGEGFRRLHGEAVGLGMLAEAEWGERRGHARGVAAALYAVLQALGAPVHWREARVDLDALARDKKRMGDTMIMPVVGSMGSSRLEHVAVDELVDFAQATMLPAARWRR